MLTPFRRRTPAAPAPVLPAPMFVARGDVRLDDATVERLAVALHERRHGAHVPEHGKAECARLSGAYDDVYVLEPLIVDLLKGQPA